MKKKRIEKIVIPAALFCTILLLVFLLTDAMKPSSGAGTDGPALPVWASVAAITLTAVFLVVLLWMLVDRVCLGSRDGAPGSASYLLVIKLATLWRRGRQNLTVDGGKLEGVEAPFVLLCNHVSFYDFYYVVELLKGYRPAFVINHHICSAPVLRHFSKKTGMIPKKMFTPDTAAIKMLRTVRAGHPVVVFPEGRLSIDGRGSPIVENATAFYKRLGVPLILAHISGAYCTYPKWRGKFYRGDVGVSVLRVITPDELKQTPVEELDRVIEAAFCYDETKELSGGGYRQKDKARGLESFLYRCADCGTLYSTRSRGNELYCVSCKKVHRLDGDYRFTDGVGSIPGYYDRIKELERAELDGVALKAPVSVRIFSDKKPRVRKEKGVCTLDRAEFTYRSDKIAFAVPTEKLPALAFSCGKEFELYYNDEQYYFYPDDRPLQVARWSLIIDLLREERIENGKEKSPD